MTLLHYASKSGAAGIGDGELAAKMVTMLISKGSDLNIRCRWTNMTALHYSAYFDVVPVIKVLLKATKALGIIPLSYGSVLFYISWFTNKFVKNIYLIGECKTFCFTSVFQNGMYYVFTQAGVSTQ